MDFGRLGRSRGDQGRLSGPGLVELFAVVVGRFPQVGGKLLEKLGGVGGETLLFGGTGNPQQGGQVANKVRNLAGPHGQPVVRLGAGDA